MPSQKKKKNKATTADIKNVNAFVASKTPLCVAQEAVANLLKVPRKDTKVMSMRACKRALKGVYINIFDYVAKKYKKQVSSLNLLRKRCEVRGFYPKEDAKSNNLKVLLTLFRPGVFIKK